MDSFLASLKNESREYKKTAVAIDEIQREFSVRFDELEDQAILKVKNIKRPMTVMQKSRFAKEVKVKPRSARSELARAKSNLRNQKKPPNTARNFSRGNNFDVDYRRKPTKTSQNPKIWVTDDYPVTTRNADPNTAFNRVNYPNIYFSNTDNDDDYNSNPNTSRRIITNDPFQVSSHHFDYDRFEGPKTARRPKTSQKWTSPVCVRKIERKLTDDERLWDDPPIEKMVF